MKEKLETVLKTLEEARRQLDLIKESDGQWDASLEDIELGIEWVRKKLQGLRDQGSHP
jgi:hypothetical protein